MHTLNYLVCHFYHYDEQAYSKLTSCISQHAGKSVTILLDGYNKLTVNLLQHKFYQFVP